MTPAEYQSKLSEFLVNCRIDDKVSELLALSTTWFVSVDASKVNIDDLLNLRPGTIVRCSTDPRNCIQTHYAPDAYVGCIAGWISEDE